MANNKTYTILKDVDGFCGLYKNEILIKEDYDITEGTITLEYDLEEDDVVISKNLTEKDVEFLEVNVFFPYKITEFHHSY